MVDIKNELAENSILLSVFSGEFYNRSLNHLLKNLSSEKICYVSLNKTAESLTKSFRFSGINTKNIFFIDAISPSLKKGSDISNGIVVSSPYAFTELSIAIEEVLKSKIFSLVVFDSLSTLKVYGNDNNAIRFTSGIINKIRSKEDKGIFTCLKEDTKTNLIQQSLINIDKVVDFKDVEQALSENRIKLIGSSLVALVALLATPFLLSNPNSPTGFVSFPLHSPTLLSYLVLSAAFAIGILFIFRNKFVKTVDLKNINAPMKILNKETLRKRFRNKIIAWSNLYLY